ncbi:ROK family transcriptional regulator [Cellulomonas biazotea]|uniref:NagC family transcriptional regulator n=1 Tax=Cellulomonas biazotea TaxID=1709 RepID=A0A402DVK0_9CELL|nr:ROK family transcriptional regulator [Cellulomonas biazotea]GCE78180.1 NagC family transcriptional regulator [Cellulomonas biazotea]
MAGSQSSLREANRAAVVDAVKRHGGLTQVELVGATGLSAATVSTIVKQLLAEGVVETRSTIRTGRRAQLVTLAHRVGLAVGVHVGHRHLRVAIADFTHEVLAERVLPLPQEHRVDTSLDRLALLVVDLLERLGLSISDVVGIGVGLPAPVDDATGMISVRGIMRSWDEVHVGHVISKRLALPVYVDNDANLGALAESTRGASRVYRDSVYVRASYGTGAGIVISHQVHRGFAGTAGEIGHVQVDPQGDICRCGSRGCLDTVVGARALVEPLRASHGNLTLRDVVQRANEGDPGCAQVIADAGAQIGVVVSGVAMTVNPQCIVVGGELAETGEILLTPMREAIRRRVLLNQIAPLEVIPAELGNAAEVAGAIALVLQNADIDLDPTAAAGVGAEAERVEVDGA